MENSDLAIDIRGFRKKYGEQVAVRNLTLEVKRGTFFGFVGPNGAGKSTTINAMVGLLQPTSGEIRVAGYDISKEPLKAKREIGFMPEEVVLYERLTAKEFLDFAGRMYGLSPEIVKTRRDELIELLDLDPDKLMGTFSLGMRKKAALASALIHMPQVVILDEPFSGIDATTGSKIRNALVEMVKNGHTVFFSSHVLETVEKISTQIGVINKGELLACGTLDTIIFEAECSDGASLEDAFLKLVGRANSAKPGE